MERSGKETEVREVQAAEEKGGNGHEDILEGISSEEDESGENNEEDEDAKEDEAAVQEEGVKARSPPQPRLPTTDERRLHELTHWLLRSSCEHCQRG